MTHVASEAKRLVSLCIYSLIYGTSACKLVTDCHKIRGKNIQINIERERFIYPKTVQKLPGTLKMCECKLLKFQVY